MEIISKIIEFIFAQLSNWIGVFSSFKRKRQRKKG